jgi:acylphosphatase
MSVTESGDWPDADLTGGAWPDADLTGGAVPGDDAGGDDAGGDDAAGDAVPGGAVPGDAAAGDAAAGSDAAGDRDAPARLTAWLAGQVQGVGLRWWIRERALELGLVGSAENLEDGRVKVIAEGAAVSCQELLALLAGPGTPGRVTRVTQRWDNPRGGITGFTEG